MFTAKQAKENQKTKGTIHIQTIIKALCNRTEKQIEHESSFGHSEIRVKLSQKRYAKEIKKYFKSIGYKVKIEFDGYNENYFVIIKW